MIRLSHFARRKTCDIFKGKAETMICISKCTLVVSAYSCYKLKTQNPKPVTMLASIFAALILQYERSIHHFCGSYSIGKFWGCLKRCSCHKARCHCHQSCC